jgi:hypothetical protein
VLDWLSGEERERSCSELVSGAEAGSFTVELRPQPTKIVAYQNGAMYGEPSTKCPSLSRPVEAQAACASR